MISAQQNDCGIDSCLTLSDLLSTLKQRYTSGLIGYGNNDTMINLIKHEPVPNVPGVITICGSYGVNQLELVTVISSGPTSMHQSGIRSKLTRKSKNNPHDNFLKEQIKTNEYKGLLIWWYATMQDGHNDLPSYVSNLILNTYFQEAGKLPPGYAERS